MTTNSSVANVTFAFAGHSIQIYGSKRENHGSYEVLLDGNVSETVNGSTSSSGGFQQVLFNANGLDDREHFVTVQNLEDGMYLDIDYVSTFTSIERDYSLFGYHRRRGSRISVTAQKTNSLSRR
jgi:hypothetical protein